MRTQLWIIITALTLGWNINAQKSIYSEKDSIYIEMLLRDEPCYCQKEDQGGIISAAINFMNVPYQASTLEGEPKESLIIKIDGLDCATFVEMSLALAKCQLNILRDFSDFRTNLQLIRYRDGKINEYPSRLHYFSDWINDNIRKGLFREITKTLPGAKEQNCNFNFMSKNADKYAALKQNPSFIPKIQAQENTLQKLPIQYLPKEQLTTQTAAEIRSGDIIAITTSIEGLDIVHIGFAYWQEGELFLLHASQQKGEVIISDEPLSKYLEKRKIQTGIRVIRAIF